MGKTRDLFKKIRDRKGFFLAKMGLIKDRNGMDLTEAEDIKNRSQKTLPGWVAIATELWYLFCLACCSELFFTQRYNPEDFL